MATQSEQILTSRVDLAFPPGGRHVASAFYPAPFPSKLPTIELPKISLRKLLNNDHDESERILEICKTSGFFHLDLLDHPLGRQMWINACELVRFGQDQLTTTPLDEKSKYKPLSGVAVFDRGYQMIAGDREDHPIRAEFVNVPQSEYFGTKRPGFSVAPWLSASEQLFQSMMENGSLITQSLLSVLESGLQLEKGSLTNLHRLRDDSSDFIRILRYPGTMTTYDLARERFPAHRDAISVAILFTWLGGLQIVTPNAEVDNLKVREEDWRWVQPLPGYVVLNLGDALAVLTNSVLKSGVHRVVAAPGAQRSCDRYSLLLGARPKNDSPMRAFESPQIPRAEHGEKVMTSLEWGHNLVLAIRKRLEAERIAKQMQALQRT